MKLLVHILVGLYYLKAGNGLIAGSVFIGNHNLVTVNGDRTSVIGTGGIVFGILLLLPLLDAEHQLSHPLMRGALRQIREVLAVEDIVGFVFVVYKIQFLDLAILSNLYLKVIIGHFIGAIRQFFKFHTRFGGPLVFLIIAVVSLIHLDIANLQRAGIRQAVYSELRLIFRNTHGSLDHCGAFISNVRRTDAFSVYLGLHVVGIIPGIAVANLYLVIAIRHIKLVSDLSGIEYTALISCKTQRHHIIQDPAQSSLPVLVSPIKVLVIVRILVVCQNLALGSGLQEGIVLLIIQGYQTPAVAFLIIRPIQLIGLAV